MGFNPIEIDKHIRTLEYLITHREVPIGSHSAIRDAICVLREEIPMQPGNVNGYCCPECGGDVIENKEYCPNCGQRIDWSWE